MKLAGLFLTAVLLFASPSWAQMKARINWTAVTGAQSGVYVAQEEGLFKRNGLDVELIHIPSSSRGIQAILAELGEKEPAAKAAKPDDFIDMRFVAKLEKEGFFKKLWDK